MHCIYPSIATISVASLTSFIICLPGLDAIAHLQSSGLVFVFLGTFFPLYPILRYKICYDKNIVYYRSIFNKNNINIADISIVDAIFGNRLGLFGPTVGLRIFSKYKIDPVIIINVKVFSRNDISVLLRVLDKSTRDSTLA